MNRNETIDAILAAARKPCPEIVPVIRYHNVKTGHTCGMLGFPVNANHDDYERVDAGYCFADKNGTRYGKPEATAEALRQRHEDDQDREMADFRANLESSDEERLAEQAGYWIGASA